MQDFAAALAAARARAKRRDDLRKRVDDLNDASYWWAFSKGELYRETTYGHGKPGKAKPLGKVVSFIPTADDLRKHMQRYGNEGVGAIAHALGIDMKVKSKASLQKRHRRTTEELRGEVLALHEQGLLPAAISDELNVAERRVRELLAAAA